MEKEYVCAARMGRRAPAPLADCALISGLLYLRGVAPPEVTTMHIYKGVVPFICIQLLMLVILAMFPALATWLPKVIFG